MLSFERFASSLCGARAPLETPSSFSQPQVESKITKVAMRFFRSLCERVKSLFSCKTLERRVSVPSPAHTETLLETKTLTGPKTEAPKAYADPLPEGAYVVENDKPSLSERDYMDVKFLLLDSGRLVRPNSINLDAQETK